MALRRKGLGSTRRKTSVSPEKFSQDERKLLRSLLHILKSTIAQKSDEGTRATPSIGSNKSNAIRMHTDHEGKNGSAVTGRGRSSHIDLASDSDADAEDDSDDDSGNDDEKEGSALGLSTSDDRNMKLDAATVIGDLYEQCNVLKEKLHSLENAMSRLGGAQDAVRCIRKLRRSLQFSKDLNDFKKYGQINDAKDDTFYNSFAPMKSHVEKVLENAEAMKEAFHQFGSVNGCQLISLCGSLQRICLETGYIANKMSRFVSVQGKAKTLATKRIISLSGFANLSNDFHILSKEIMRAIRRDIPNLRSAQQLVSDRYTNMTTTAAFFSGISATAIQMSFPMTDSTLAHAVNTAWFTSLVFSITSVIMSLLGLSWFQSRIPRRTEETTLKRGAIFFLRNGPVMFMAAAATMFMVGLALFVNVANQARSTSIVTSCFIAAVSVILIFLAMCFALLYQNTLSWSWGSLTSYIKRLEHVATKMQTEDYTKPFLDEPGTYKSVIDQGAIQVTLGGFDGPLAVADSGASSLSIYKDYQVSPQTIYLDTEKFFGTPKQLLWSPDNENLLIRMSNSLSLWSEKNSVRELFTSPILIQDALWIKDSLRVLVIQTELLTFIDGHTGLPVATLPLHGIRVVAAQGIGNDYLACIADDFLNGNTVRKLLVLNCNTAEVVYGGTRIKNSAYSLRLAKDDFDDNLNKVLLSFEDGSEPQLWYLKQSGLTLWEAKPMFKYDKGPSLCVSPASFAGGTNKLVVCVASYYESLNADTIWVWSTDEAMLIHRVDIEKVHSSLPISVSWKIDDFWQLALAAAYDDGKTVKTGKICFFDSIDAYQEMTKSDIQAVLKT